MSDDIPLAGLFGLLVVLLLLSAFFSGSETALMSLNRYRLRHKARAGHRGARMAESLLQRPDRLLGLILLGNNLANLSAAALVAVIALELGGEPAVAIATLILTLVVLVFSETAPKALCALHPEAIGYPAAYVYYMLLKVAYPFVWLVNAAANGALWLVGARQADTEGHSLSREELRTVVYEAGARISRRYRRVLLNILDLERVTVDDVMVPHNEIVGVDLDDSIEEISAVIRRSEHTRLPVYRDTIDDVVGILHLRRLAKFTVDSSFEKPALQEILDDPYFIPEGTPLSTQLVQFQKARQRFALVVDEYGDIQGLVTLEDILEEIVGEFTTAPSGEDEDIVKESDYSFVVQGTANIREMNKVMNWTLPTDGPKTLNGLILEYLETIPESGIGLKIDGYPIEILETNGNRVRKARIYSRREEDRAAVE